MSVSYLSARRRVDGNVIARGRSMLGFGVLKYGYTVYGMNVRSGLHTPGFWIAQRQYGVQAGSKLASLVPIESASPM
jgi:hypothetical protein